MWEDRRGYIYHGCHLRRYSSHWHWHIDSEIHYSVAIMKRKRMSYTAQFKLKVIALAESSNNCHAGRECGVSERHWTTLLMTFRSQRRNSRSCLGAVMMSQTLRGSSVVKLLSLWCHCDLLMYMSIKCIYLWLYWTDIVLACTTLYISYICDISINK